MKKSAEQLKEELRGCTDIQPGTRWMHRSGSIADVIAVGHLAMPADTPFDAEPCVIYMHDKHVWSRPVTMFRDRFAEMPSRINQKKKS